MKLLPVKKLSNRGRRVQLPEAEIIKFYHSGASLRGTARRYRCTHEAVRYILLKYGQKLRPAHEWTA